MADKRLSLDGFVDGHRGGGQLGGRPSAGQCLERPAVGTSTITHDRAYHTTAARRRDRSKEASQIGLVHRAIVPGPSAPCSNSRLRGWGLDALRTSELGEGALKRQGDVSNRWRDARAPSSPFLLPCCRGNRRSLERISWRITAASSSIGGRGGPRGRGATALQ